MAFTAEPTRTPSVIGDISVQIFDPDPTGAETQAIQFGVIVKFDDGTVVERTGNLTAHLTAQQITDLQAFMASLRTQANAELLP